MPELKYQHGRLSFRQKSTGAERGREDWWLTRNRDGSTTMRALAITDEAKLVRDVIYTRGANGRPTDAFIRLQVAEQLIGLGYFRVQGDTMQVIVDSDQTGHVTQTLAVPPAYFSIATHTAMLDGWMIFNYDRAQAGEQLRTIYNTSARWHGADGPLGRMETSRVRVVNEEEIEVPAGRFKATHFQINSDVEHMPAPHLWVAGQDRILLRYDSSELDLEYVLTAWKTEY